MLRPSRKTLYALDAVVDVAYNGGAEPAQSGEITRRQGVRQRYLEQVMQRLVRAGVLKGVRGPRGGYCLARERRRITVGEVVRVVNDLDADGDPFADKARSELADKIVHPLWRQVERDVMERLDAISIEDLCRRAHAKGIERQARDRPHFDI